MCSALNFCLKSSQCHNYFSKAMKTQSSILKLSADAVAPNYFHQLFISYALITDHSSRCTWEWNGLNVAAGSGALQLFGALRSCQPSFEPIALWNSIIKPVITSHTFHALMCRARSSPALALWLSPSPPSDLAQFCADLGENWMWCFSYYFVAHRKLHFSH